MKASTFFLFTLKGFAVAFSPLKPRAAGCQPALLDAATNIWKNYTLHPNPVYQRQVLEGAARIQDADLKTKALKIADVGSFIWLNKPATLSVVENATANAPCNHIIGVVLQGMHSPYDCSNPRFRPTDLETYQKSYVDPLANILKANPGTAFAIIIEPEAVSTIVLNSDLASCKPLKDSYNVNAIYALKTLSLPNTVLYLDAGHGGTLGWESNLKPGADYLASIVKGAGSPSQVRGFSVNVAGWNSWDLQPGEFVTTRETPRNRAQNEKTFVTLLGDLLGKAGVPNHAIMDTSRNAIQGLRMDWSEWCNVNGAGFGRRPTAEGTKLELADAFVWAKGGGLSDGTSDPSSFTYNSFCGKPTAFKPSPEEGEWNQAYFEMLLENAKPVLI